MGFIAGISLGRDDIFFSAVLPFICLYKKKKKKKVDDFRIVLISLASFCNVRHISVAILLTDALSSQIKYFPAGHAIFNFFFFFGKELFENVSLVVESVNRIPCPLQCHSSSHNSEVNRKQAVSGINRNK